MHYRGSFIPDVQSPISKGGATQIIAFPERYITFSSLEKASCRTLMIWKLALPGQESSMFDPSDTLKTWPGILATSS
jgi:hypothetical protein